MSHLIAPSLLSADFSNLKKDIEMVNDSEADWFHLDIMDGHFVPNIKSVASRISYGEISDQNFLLKSQPQKKNSSH